MRPRAFLTQIQSTPLLLALVIWLCTLPVLLLVGAWFLDWQATVSLVALVLLAELIACWFICRAPEPHSRHGPNRR